MKSLVRSIFFAFLCCGGVSLVHAEEVKIAGTGAGLGTMRMLSEAYALTRSDVNLTVLPSMGTSGGIKAVLAGAIQIAVTARPLKESEARTGATVVEYGRTPFVFAVSRSSKATQITTQELIDIYSGRMSQWSDGTKIRLVLRPVGDADSDLIKEISPAMRAAHTLAEQRQGMLFSVTDQETADDIEKIPGALGPSTLALLLSEKRALKPLLLDGVEPNAGSLANGRYPLVKTMYVVVDAKASPVVQDFIAFIRSPAGRQILTRTGHWVR